MGEAELAFVDGSREDSSADGAGDGEVVDARVVGKELLAHLRSSLGSGWVS